MLLKIISHSDNFLLRMADDGFVTTSDFVFRFGLKKGGRTLRMVVPAGARLRKAKRGRARATLVRRAVAAVLSRKSGDDAYCAAMRADGVGPISAAIARTWRFAAGVLRHQWRYWRATPTRRTPEVAGVPAAGAGT